MTVNSSPQIESAKHQQEPKSSLYLQVIELSQNISFVHFGNIMPMGGEKLWSYVSEVLKIVKQNWRAIFQARKCFFLRKKPAFAFEQRVQASWTHTEQVADKLSAPVSDRIASGFQAFLSYLITVNCSMECWHNV